MSTLCKFTNTKEISVEHLRIATEVIFVNIYVTFIYVSARNHRLHDYTLNDRLDINFLFFSICVFKLYSQERSNFNIKASNTGTDKERQNTFIASIGLKKRLKILIEKC